MKKGTILLFGAYFLGVSVASNFSQKAQGQLKKEMEESGDALGVLFKNFAQVHQDLFLYGKDLAMTPENMEKLEAKKEQLLQVVDAYKKEGEVFLEELKLKGVDYSKDVQQKLEELYEEKKAELEKMRQHAPEKVAELKQELVETLKHVLEKVKKMQK